MMNKDWLDTKLGDIAKITCGIAATPEYVDESVGVPFLSARNVQDGKLDLSKFMYIPKELHIKLTKNTKPKKGDVLLTRVGAGIGKAAFVDIDFEFSVYVSLTLIQCKGMLDGNFLTFLLNTNYYQYLANRDQFAGGGVQNLNVQMVKGYPVSIPPLPEQIKIAEILSTWDNAINTVQKLLANSQQQKKALMQQLLTSKKRFSGFEKDFVWKTLDCCVDVDSESLTNKTDSNFRFKYISLSDVNKGLISENLEICVFDKAPSRARRILKADDILMATVRPNLQGFAKVSQKFESCIASTGFSVLRAKRNFDSDYIYQYLFSKVLTDQIESLVVGTNYPAINSSDIKNLQVYIPIFHEQQKIAAVLTTADQEIDNLRAQLNQLKQEKKALMQQLLTGKRRVKVEEAA